MTNADVGDSYRYNAPFSAAHSLRDISTGATVAVKRELSKQWVAGMQSGFNSVAATRSLVSTADVFRTSKLDLIVRSFQRRLVALSRGRLMRVPPRAPGTNRVLIRGKMQSFTVLLYQWQHGRNVLSVWQIGPVAALNPNELFALARRQDAKAR